jgi:hypothetical protein
MHRSRNIAPQVTQNSTLQMSHYLYEKGPGGQIKNWLLKETVSQTPGQPLPSRSTNKGSPKAETNIYQQRKARNGTGT